MMERCNGIQYHSTDKIIMNANTLDYFIKAEKFHADVWCFKNISCVQKAAWFKSDYKHDLMVGLLSAPRSKA